MYGRLDLQVCSLYRSGLSQQGTCLIPKGIQDQKIRKFSWGGNEHRSKVLPKENNMDIIITYVMSITQCQRRRDQ